jgi:hypothetical protein
MLCHDRWLLYWQCLPRTAPKGQQAAKAEATNGVRSQGCTDSCLSKEGLADPGNKADEREVNSTSRNDEGQENAVCAAMAVGYPNSRFDRSLAAVWAVTAIQ